MELTGPPENSKLLFKVLGAWEFLGYQPDCSNYKYQILKQKHCDHCLQLMKLSRAQNVGALVRFWVPQLYASALCTYAGYNCFRAGDI
eukprot:3755897-Rhodomonas_salina.1